VPRPTAGAESRGTKNIMKRIGSISLFILLTSWILASCTTTPTAAPTPQTGVLTLDMPPACKALEEGLCVVSEPGEFLGEGKTTVINQKPEATFLEQSTAIQIKVEGWTVIFDPGENTPFSVGMTFPNAKLYPQGQNAGMSVENNGKKCDEVEGEFTDDILQTAIDGDRQVNPISSFDIRFTMRCNQETPVIIGRVKLSQ
jgi:hypothetical protein